MYDFIIHAAAAIPVPCSRGPAGPISLKTVHWTVFRALDVPVPFDLPLAIPLTSRQISIYLQLPYSLPLHPSLRGRGGGQGHGFGGQGLWGRDGSQLGRQSRFTQTTRFPHSSTPSSTSATSPGRQGFSIVTRRQAQGSGIRPAPQRSAPNMGTRTQSSRPPSHPSRGYSGILS